MKSLSLLLPAVVSAAVAQNPTYPYKSTTTVLKAQIRSNSNRTLTRVGPLNLLPGNTGRHGFTLDSNGQGLNFMIPAGTFCGGECTILSGHAGLQYEDGTPADVSNGVYIHHILGSNYGKLVQPFVSQCDTKGDVMRLPKPPRIPAGFVGVSDDNGDQPIMYGTKSGEVEGGYFISPKDSFGIWADIVNLDKTPKKVYLTYDLEFLPGHVGADSQGSLISVTGCFARGINMSPTKPANTTSGKFRFFNDGYLVNGKGHLHDGGVAMDFFINDKLICSSNALYGGQSGTRQQENGKKWETISGMSICDGPYKIKNGDYMSIVARYDLASHPPRENGDHKMAEAMGMWTMNFIDEKGSQPIKHAV